MSPNIEELCDYWERGKSVYLEDGNEPLPPHVREDLAALVDEVRALHRERFTVDKVEVMDIHTQHRTAKSLRDDVWIRAAQALVRAAQPVFAEHPGLMEISVRSIPHKNILSSGVGLTPHDHCCRKQIRKAIVRGLTEPEKEVLRQLSDGFRLIRGEG